MAQQLTAKFTFLILILGCLIGTVYASGDEDFILSEDDDVIFSVIPDFRDIACSFCPTIRQETYTLKNTEPAAFRLSNFNLTTTDSLSASILSIDSSSSCVTAGKILGFSTCDIIIDIMQPPCDNLEGPRRNKITALLSMKVGSAQLSLRRDFDFDVTTIGSGADFAILGGLDSIVTNLPGAAIAQLVGDLGTGNDSSDIVGDFDIIDGTAYTAGKILDNARIDMASTQAVFLGNLGGCTSHGNLVDGDEFTPDYYCLANAPAPDGTDITVDGTITLNGTGNFVFFVNAEGTGGVDEGEDYLGGCTGPIPPVYCGLQFNPTANFVYLNGATKENVYWVVGVDENTA
ncbi:MAG TPA: hypothetical protein VI522_01635, partial [Gammaproteobacteria bacterium]|nr:hypothetical protein [Gammaproteobacteria bacterium]